MGANIRHLRLAILAFFVLALCPRPGHAQDALATFKGKTFDLPIPAGFCIAEPSNSLAVRFTALMKNSGATVVKVALDCGELRRGTKQYDYFGYYYPSRTEQEVLDGDTQVLRKAVCDALRGVTQAAVDDIPSIVAKTAKELKQKFDTNDSKYLGVLAEDAHGCYAGLLANIGSGTKDHYIMNTDMLGTVVHARQFYAGLYSEYASPAQSQKMLEIEEALAAELDAKNPD
jgi:hypothetical protein